MGAMARAEVRYVSPSGSDDPPYTNWATAARHIQSAVDACVNGDRVDVAEGQYVLASTLVVAKGITVRAAGERTRTIIDGAGAYTCLQMRHLDAMVCGFTITNGVGGVYINNGGTLRACEVAGCNGVAGGGVYVYTRGVIADCIIRANTSLNGGGGVFLDGGGTLTNCQIVNNCSKTHGGGIYLAGGSPEVFDCVIEHNRAMNQGGGVNFNEGSGGKSILSKCTIRGNQAASGGGLYLFKGTVRNCLIYNNIATDGGAAFVKQGLFESCTIALNCSTDGVGGMRLSGGGSIENSIVYYNQRANYGTDGGGMTFDYTCIFPNPGGTGNITNDPQFLQLDDEEFHCAQQSPCVDAGINRDWMVGATDLDGMPRIWNGRVDMGVYEMVAPGFIDITTTPTWVSYNTMQFPVAGTNNELIVGGMYVSNAANGVRVSFPEGLAWVTPAVPLNVGANRIYVAGTNEFGVTFRDSVVITRGGPGTEAPFVDVTSEYAWVRHTVTAYAVAGTNNVHVVGGMMVSNRANDALASFRADESWTTPELLLAVGANELVVSGTNLLDQTATDSIMIERGPRGTGLPFVDITNDNTWVRHTTTSYTIAGTNNLEVMGTMTWVNALNGASGTLAAPWDEPLDWTVADIPLAIGANVITVTGTNLFGETSSDSVTITRGPRGTGLPFVDITNDNAWVRHTTTAHTIAGTNNLEVMGTMTWVNALNGASGTLVAPWDEPLNWTVADIPLAIGANVITVTGTNLFGERSSDSVTITRGPRGTGLPFVDITSDNAWVRHTTTAYTIAGTNNLEVMGTMTWVNTLNGASGTLEAPWDEPLDWTIADIPLAVGENVITVTGTNLFGETSSDSVTITRGPRGTGLPFVDITNDNAWVRHTTTLYTIAGTNNLEVMGTMTWVNALNGASGTLAAPWDEPLDWTAADIPLAVGENVITVTGTNLFGETSSDSVTITRGPRGTGLPFVNITNDNAWVRHTTTAYTIAGTNNLEVMGTMTWVNALNGASGTLAAPWDEPLDWTVADIPLAIGANAITVTGTNLFGETSSDSVTITRGPRGTGLPFVNITNDNAWVRHTTTAYTIGGTNNLEVMGTMTWVNTLNGASGTLEAPWDEPLDWTIADIPLAVGANEITVTGTNLFGETSSDSVTITRGPRGSGLPFVNITNDAVWVRHTTTQYTVAGTNNLEVVGTMTWNNLLNGAQGALPAPVDEPLHWIIPDIPLDIGDNVISVTGTNLFGASSTDRVTITRRARGTGLPYVDITNADFEVNYHIPQVAIGGTNNLQVFGAIWWMNETSGEGGMVTRTDERSWMLPAIALMRDPTQRMVNVVRVTGTNLLNESAADVIRITVGLYNGVPSNDVLCVWPRLIGQDQTGTVEFISTMDTSYDLLGVHGSVTQVIASGACAAGWNLVPFYSGMLPAHTVNTTNWLMLRLHSAGVLGAGGVVVVPDLQINGVSRDMDGELISVKCKSKNPNARVVART